MLGLEKALPERVFPVERGDAIERPRSECNCRRLDVVAIALVRSREFAESSDCACNNSESAGVLRVFVSLGIGDPKCIVTSFERQDEKELSSSSGAGGNPFSGVGS